jgi:transcriptional regulator with XRE-family HTH domain
MNLFDRVKELSKKEGVTLAELERILGFSKGSLHKWSASSPSVDKLEAVADYFHVSINYLLCRTNDPIDYDDPDLIAAIPDSLLESTNGNVKKALEIKHAIEEDGKQDSALHHEVAAASSDIPYDELPPEAIQQLEDYKKFLIEKYGKKK